MKLLLLAALLLSPADRAEDRVKIRRHIDRIYQAFIHKNLAELRATHNQEWLGFMTWSEGIIHGRDGYMEAVRGIEGSPYGMTSYKLREFDVIFNGDSAYATFVSEAEVLGPNGKDKQVLRIGDFFIKKNGEWIQAGTNTAIHQEDIARHEEMPQTMAPGMKKALFEAREAVWRSFFSNDRAALEKLIPEETLTMSPGSARLGNRASVLEGAAQLAQSGAKLARLEFPTTEIQYYGSTAILYSTYLYELEKEGKRVPYSGRVTEVFVHRQGQWVNPGWHMEAAPERPVR